MKRYRSALLGSKRCSRAPELPFSGLPLQVFALSRFDGWYWLLSAVRYGLLNFILPGNRGHASALVGIERPIPSSEYRKGATR